MGSGLSLRKTMEEDRPVMGPGLSSFETAEEEPAVVGSARSLSAQDIIF